MSDPKKNILVANNAQGTEKSAITIVRRPPKVMSLDAVLALARDVAARDAAAHKTQSKQNIIDFFSQRGFAIRTSRDDGEDAHGGLFTLHDPATSISGIIIDARDNYKIIATPPPDVSRDDDAVRSALNNIDKYDVYPALDGTRVTLFHHADTWLMATARLFDAREYKWMGQKTYEEAFVEAARSVATLAHVTSFAKFTEMCDKAQTYVFIFRHHDFHPMSCDPQGLWQVSGPKIEGVPQYVPMAREDIPSAERMPFLARNAFSDFARKHIINYGYILRPRAGTNAPCAVYLESTLHEFVRKQMYDFPANTQHLTPETRQMFMHLRAYINYGMNHVHLMLFPCASDIYAKMDVIISALTELTVVELRAGSAGRPRADGRKIDNGELNGRRIAGSQSQNTIGAELFGKVWDQVYKQLVAIARGAAKQIAMDTTMSAFGDHVRVNVRDRYLCAQNMQEFMNLLSM